jgi:beta-galactosidase
MPIAGTLRFALLLFAAVAMYAGAVRRAVAEDVDAGEAGFEGVREARVEMTNGVPRLMINGRPVLPLVFFPNTDVPGEWSEKMLREQVALAADAGVHIYSFPFRIQRSDDGAKPDYTVGEQRMQTMIDIDPKAVFILRVYPGPWPFWKEWKDFPEGEISLFADGTSNFISVASEFFRKYSNEDLAAAVRHLEASPYGQRIICYHPGGPEHEMFMDRYREKGPDYSAANQRGFRRWLKGTYKTDAALQAAWGGSDVTLDTAAIPETEPGRFPMHGARGGETAEIFYQLPEEQDWIDYSRYGSDIVTDRLLEWARIVKAESQGKKLTAFFYGYTFELCGSFSGHYRLDRVLECPDVDILASPISYVERLGGEPGAFMSLVDTITAHGKLWFNEDDTRTSYVDPDKVPPHISLWQGHEAKSHDETLGILDRNLGAILVHRAGTWWMDLIGAGAFNAPEAWKMLSERAPLYSEVYADPAPYRPDVAVIVDEQSKTVVKSDWDANYWLMMQLRNESMRTGAAVGFYSLDDFVSGAVPACKVYVFPNAFVLTGNEIDAMRARLDKEQAPAVWVYAPNCFGPAGFDASRAESLTGITIELDPGRQGSRGVGLLDGLTWGKDVPVQPRPVVRDGGAEVLGRYVDGGRVSAAAKEVGHHRSVYVADMSLTADVFRRLFELGGAHIWAGQGEVVHCDGRFLMAHHGPAGPIAIRLPQGVGAKAISGTVVHYEDGVATMKGDANATVWLRLLPKDRP